MTELEQPAQDYFPAARVRLIIRFEEFGATDTPEPPAVPPQLRTGETTLPNALTVEDQDGKLVLVSPSSNQDGGPQKQQASTDGRTHVIDGVIPMSASLQRNGVRIADTLSLSLLYVDLPFDPRVIRSCAVEYYLGTLSVEEFERGQAGSADNPEGADALPLNVLPDDRSDGTSNVRFLGWVDEWEVDVPEEADAMVHLTCTDNTRLFLEQDAPPKLSVGTKKPLDEAVAEYLANFPQFAGMEVEYRPKNAEPPLLSEILQPTAFSEKVGPPPVGDNTMVWDYLTDIAGSVGHTIRVDGVTVVIQRAKTLYDGRVYNRRPDDVFKGRILPSGRELTNRMMVYGRNVKEMNFAREFARYAPLNVEVRCFPGDTVVRAAGIEKGYSRWYEGAVVRVTTSDNGILTGTPNHPVLTAQRGWVPLDALEDGEDLVTGFVGEGVEAFRDPHVDEAPAEIGEVLHALLLVGVPERRPVRPVDFHGDGGAQGDGEVQVVSVGSVLRDRGEPDLLKDDVDILLEPAGEGQLGLTGLRSRKLGTSDLVSREGLPAGGGVHAIGEGRSLLGSEFPESVLGGGTVVSDLDAEGDEGFPDATGVDAERLAELVKAGAIEVTTCKVVGVERSGFAGHVYNLQTESGYYRAGGIIAHNCYEPRRKKTLVSRYPTSDGKRQKRISPGDAADQKWVVFRVAGVGDEPTLRIIAQGIYEALSRNEITASFSTHDLASYGGGNDDPDLLDLQAGDTVDLEVNRELDEFSTFNSVEEIVASRAEGYLKSLGYEGDMAKAYAKAMSDAGFITSFRVRDLTIDWDSDTPAVSINCNLVNYLEVRADNVLPEGEEIPPDEGGAKAPEKVDMEFEF